MAPPTTSKRKHGQTPKVRRAPRATAKITPEQLAAIKKEVDLLPGLIRANYTKWTDGGKPFQLKCMGAQVMGKDCLLHAATGSGKTGIAAGPHLLPSSKGKVTLMVSPLLSLHDEQVSTFRNEFGLKATAINSSNGGCTKEIMQKVVSGEWQIVMVSPEMLLSRRFVDGVLRKPAFGSRCLSVFIDEAHCVSHWGASFRKKYASIGIVRAFLPRTTPIIAVTATLTPRVRQDLEAKLQFPTDYLFESIGNDRPTVSQVIRSMQHAANSYRDVDFMVDTAMKTPEDVKLAFLYTDDIKDGSKLIDHLNARVCPAYRSRGLVRPYNAGMSRQYRDHVMALFKAGIVRILVCTDAAGMGCDIPNIELVVQWKAPQNLSAWVQRAGRAARGKGTRGMAIMIVEKSAFEVSALPSQTADTPSSSTRGRGRGRGRGGRGGTGRRGGNKQGKAYGELHGQKRGWFRATNDKITPLENADAEIPQDAPSEGLYALIQATICRRLILMQIFRNPPLPADHDPTTCCDICNPGLFDTVRPSKPVKAVRQKGILKGPPVDSVRQSLFQWRREIKRMHYSHALFAPHAILDDTTCELLASIGPVNNIEILEQLLGSSWSRWDELGTRLYAFMHGLKIPSLPARPSRAKKSVSEPTPAPPSQLPHAPPILRTPSTHPQAFTTPGPSTPGPSTSHFPPFPSYQPPAYPHHYSAPHPMPENMCYNPYVTLMHTPIHLPTPQTASIVQTQSEFATSPQLAQPHFNPDSDTSPDTH
ncbi:P-loop containing nucleoside triphosphate hydrolase protein [Mycena crocata]|nr:P-loop containing nucleoside triphosphate hydrolase protein [Mycena crocata]